MEIYRNEDHTFEKSIKTTCEKKHLIKKPKDEERVLGLDFAVIQSNDFRQEGMH